MTSMSNQQYNTKSMSGLSDTYANNIFCDTIDVADSLTLEPGGVLTLPNNSIQDSYLSNNVAFRNQANTFSLANTFTNTVQFTSTTIPVITQSIPANDATTKIPTTSWTDTYFGKLSGNQTWTGTNTFSNAVQFTSTTIPVITQAIAANDATTKIPTTAWTDLYFGKKTLATGSTVQTWFGNNKFTSNSTNLAISLDNTDAPVYDGGLFITSVAGQGNPITTVGNTVLIANGIGIDTGILSLCCNSSTSCGIRIGPTSMSIIVNTTLTMSGTTCNNNITNYNVSGICSFTNTTTPVITQSIPANDATTKISTTAWVDTYFGKKTLSTGSTLQTWFGSNRFTSNSSNLAITLQNTDAPTYIGSGLFIASAAAQLNPFVALGDTVLISNGTGINNGILCLCAASATSCGIRISGSSINLNGATTLTVNSLTTTYNNNATNYNVAGITSFTNTTTPVITEAISLADNSTKIATTAFVKDQNYITSTALTPYALLAPTALQTFAGTAQNTFNNQVNVNAGIRFVDTFTSKISQQGSALVIENISNVNSVQIRTTTSGLVQRTGLLIENGITCTLQGGSGNTITLTGLSTPTLGIPPVAGVYSSEIATTQWINNELVSIYARLNPTALQTWGTNENQFNTQITMNAVSTRYLNGANSSTITQTGNNLILANISNSNSVQIRTNTAGGVFSQNLLCRNGNEIVMKGDTGIVRVLNTACTIECATFSSQAPYDCGYLSIGAPITSKTNYNIGYQWQIGGAAFTGTAWGTAVGAYNIMTMVWNGTADYTLGVWLCDIVIVTNASSASSFSLCWNTISNSSMDITEKCTQSNVVSVFNATSQQITRMSFVLNITNTLQTFWLNSNRVGGAGLSSNTTYSQIKFTRIA